MLVEIFIYIIFTYGIFNIIYNVINNMMSINIKDIHNELGGREKVEVLIVFRDMDKYKNIIENRILYGNYNDLHKIVDEYRCIAIDSDKTLTL